MASTRRNDRKLYETDLYTLSESAEKQIYQLSYKDAWGAAPSVKAGKNAFRARCNGRWANTLHRYLQSYQVPTHWVEAQGEGAARVRASVSVPFSIRIWNFATDELCARIEIPKNEMLCCPVLEWYLKKSDGSLVMVGPDHLFALKLADTADVRQINRMAYKINAVLKSFLERRGIKLFNFSLSLGRIESDPLVITEGLTPDEMLLADILSSTLKKVVFFNMKEDKTAYQTLYERFSG